MNNSCRMNREQLFDWINMISFVVVETHCIWIRIHVIQKR